MTLLTNRYPAAKPIIMVLKALLNQHSLNNSYSGGLSSFALALMVVNHVQFYFKKLPNRKGVQTNQNLIMGELLLKFFDVFGNKFDYTTFGIAVTNGGSRFRKV